MRACGRWPRRLAATLALASLAVLLAHPLAGAATDVWGNVGPAPQLSGGEGPAGRYPLINYSLDQHFDAFSASLTGGVDASGVGPMLAYFFASIVWLATSFLASLLITLFGFAFSLDLLNGSQATGGAGALVPVARAIHAIYANVLGEPWLVLAISLTGIWAMWKALVLRRYSETAGALGLSLLYLLCALFFVAQPAGTIGVASKWANQMSGAFLSISSRGDVSGAREARQDAAGALFDLLVFKPWVVLEFGGLEHCARAGTGSQDSDPQSVPVRPLASDPERDAALARRLAAGSEVAAEGKVCVNNANKYAPRFLSYSLGAEEKDERDKEYEALDEGDASGLAGAERSGYRLGLVDKPATDVMEEGGQYQRLLLALVLFGGELGAFLLLGSLSIGVILAQVLLLLLLAFSPVALIAAVIPGRGHDFFKGWLEKLAGYLLRKAAYSLILAVLLAVTGALQSATAQLGWLMSFGLQSLFFWAVFLQRRALAESLVGIATGPGAPGREASLRLLSLYAGGRTAGHLISPLRRRALSAVRGEPRRARRAPLFGNSSSTVPAAAPPTAEHGSPDVAPSPSREKARKAPADQAQTPPRKPAAAGDAVAGGAAERRQPAATEPGAATSRAGGEPRSEMRQRPARPPRPGKTSGAQGLRPPAGEAGVGPESKGDQDQPKGEAKKEPRPLEQPKPGGETSTPKRERRRKGGR